jgi:hypothetical protein
VTPSKNVQTPSLPSFIWCQRCRAGHCHPLLLLDTGRGLTLSGLLPDVLLKRECGYGSMAPPARPATRRLLALRRSLRVPLLDEPLTESLLFPPLQLIGKRRAGSLPRCSCPSGFPHERLGPEEAGACGRPPRKRASAKAASTTARTGPGPSGDRAGEGPGGERLRRQLRAAAAQPAAPGLLLQPHPPRDPSGARLSAAGELFYFAGCFGGSHGLTPALEAGISGSNGCRSTFDRRARARARATVNLQRVRPRSAQFMQRSILGKTRGHTAQL